MGQVHPRAFLEPAGRRGGPGGSRQGEARREREGQYSDRLQAGGKVVRKCNRRKNFSS